MHWFSTHTACTIYHLLLADWARSANRWGHWTSQLCDHVREVSWLYFILNLGRVNNLNLLNVNLVAFIFFISKVRQDWSVLLKRLDFLWIVRVKVWDIALNIGLFILSCLFNAPLIFNLSLVEMPWIKGFFIVPGCYSRYFSVKIFLLKQAFIDILCHSGRMLLHRVINIGLLNCMHAVYNG